MNIETSKLVHRLTVTISSHKR